MRKNKHSGGGLGSSKMLGSQEPEDPYDQRGDSDEESEEDEEMRGIPRVLPMVIVDEYQIPRDFKRYRGAIDHYWTGRNSNVLIDRNKCYEYVYVDRMSQDGNTAWATMRPNYAGEYDPSTGKVYHRLGHVMTLLRFNVEENGIEYTNLVEAPSNSFKRDIKNVWVRLAPCRIPSLQYLAYRQLSEEDKQLLNTLELFPVPTFPAEEHKKGGNAVKRNKRSGRKTRRKSRKSTRRKSRRNKL